MAAAQPASSRTARTGLANRGAARLVGKTFVPVIIGRSKFCPFTAAYPVIASTCSPIAASSAAAATALVNLL